jgi:outer membrane receptor protein involved in Fe transport
MKLQLTILALLASIFSFAQNSISGIVKDDKNLPIPGVVVGIEGGSNTTTTNFDGKFTLKTAASFPLDLTFSAMGFASKKINVTKNNQSLTIQLIAQENKLNEIVVSASRTPERILESPVTVERMGAAQIKSTTASTFYDGIENMKEVHFNTSSIGFKTINTRGFANVGNTRFLQLIDGMDNSSPGLNFVLGNLLGISDIDVANVELLPGASSALYGANAFNGILFMNSKSPFTNTGATAYFKYGQTSQDEAGTNDFYDFGVRVAHKFSPHFAAKINVNYLEATEWIAADYSDINQGAIGYENNPNYDGLNVYGDEAKTFIPNVGNVARTGYNERDLNDNKVKNLKADASLHFKPFDNDIELIAQFKTGLANTIYQSANRYALRDFLMNQIKFEVRGKNFFVRSYTTAEDAGDSYDMRFAALNVNRTAKSDTQWFTDYATAYQLSSALLGNTASQAASYARNFADNNISEGLNLLPTGNAPGDFTKGKRLVPGTSEFKQAFDRVVKIPDFINGARFTDESRLYHTDVNYNFRDDIKFAEIQIGGSFRRYDLNSDGSIYTDKDGGIIYDEYGVYSQISKKLLPEGRLKFTGSVRYDKSQNFDGAFSPRVSLVYSAGAQKNHNFRVSFQTGFRNPTTQDQYIGLNLGSFALIGSAPENLAKYTETRPVSTLGQQAGQPANVTLSGNDAYYNSYVLSSVTKYRSTGNVNDLIIATPGLVKPEQVKAFEVGYKAVLLKDLTIDINGYYNIYNDFLNTARVFSPLYGRVGDTESLNAINRGDIREFQVYTNSKAEITSQGFGVGITKKIYKDFEIGANYNFAEFEFDQEKDPAFVAGFNTPKNRVKGSFGNPKLFKNFGFNTNVRWSSSYLWQAPFAVGTIPEVTVFDAQINYSLPSFYNSVIKVGGTNLGGKDYLQVVGSGRIGRQVYVSLTLNP